MTPIRVGLVGARRARQGLGPFVARELLAAGAEVPAFAGTSAVSVAEAAGALAGLGLPGARGYLGVDDLLAHEPLDALAILSPAETHAACLEAALAAGLHVLCEKPFVWGMAAPGATARRLVEGFAARGLLLHENCQWPFVLPSFEALHPGTLDAPPGCVAMRLSPSSVGRAMVIDALSHPLSLLQALTNDAPAEIAGLRFSRSEPDAPELRIDFRYETARRGIAVQIELVGRSSPPREAWLALDGHRARRTVQAFDYALALEDGARSVPLPDPLAGVVARFVGAVRAWRPGGPAARAEAVARRMEYLERIVAAYAAA